MASKSGHMTDAGRQSATEVDLSDWNALEKSHIYQNTNSTMSESGSAVLDPAGTATSRTPAQLDADNADSDGYEEYLEYFGDSAAALDALTGIRADVDDPFALGGLDSAEYATDDAPLDQWSVRQVARLLEQLGLGEYSAVFINNNINGTLLPHLDHNDLRDLGMSPLGHRVTFLSAVESLALTQSSSDDEDVHSPYTGALSMPGGPNTLGAGSLAIDLSSFAEDLDGVGDFIGSRSGLNSSSTVQTTPSATSAAPVTPASATAAPAASTAPASSASAAAAAAAATTTATTAANSEGDDSLLKRLATVEHQLAVTETQLRKLTDSYRRLRSDILPVVRRMKEAEPLPTPLRWKSSKFEPQALGSMQALAQSSSQSGQGSTLTMAGASSTGGIGAGASSGSVNNFPGLSSANLPVKPPRGTNSASPRSATSATPDSAGSHQAQHNLNPSPTSNQGVNPGSAKKFRVTDTQPCTLVLSQVLKRYNIDGNPDNYRLLVSYGDQERELGADEKPIAVYRELQHAGLKPEFRVRAVHESTVQSPTVHTPGGII